MYGRAVASGVLPSTAPHFYDLPLRDRDAWDGLALDAANTWVCDECGDEIDEKFVPEILRESES